MDQAYRPYRLQCLIDALVASVRAGRAVEEPFFHLEFDHVFPGDLYADMVLAMPAAGEFRPLPGRHKENIRPDGTSTRAKIDLFPESLRHLGGRERRIWSVVGRALRSRELRAALLERLAGGLARRFGPDSVGMYPVPVLTRDLPGYSIAPHTDTKWKGITVQLYLPRDASAAHIGTTLHRRFPDGSLADPMRMRFAPNCGYAFAVGNDTWHSADRVGHEVATRDSILLTYFVDAGPILILRNRGKRFGNFLLNEARHLMRRSRIAATQA